MIEISEELRRQMIEEAAYFRAQHRGFSDGDAVTDWLEAEEEIDTKLRNGNGTHGALEERLAATNDRLRALRKKLAGMTASAGLAAFLSFLAIVSISLGILTYLGIRALISISKSIISSSP